MKLYITTNDNITREYKMKMSYDETIEQATQRMLEQVKNSNAFKRAKREIIKYEVKF